jgi:hypothetical protein
VEIGKGYDLSTKTNSRALVGIAVTFIGVGLTTRVEGLMSIGVIVMILGVVKRDET